MAELSAEEKAKQRLLKFQEAKKKAEEQKNRGFFPKEEIPDFKTVILKKEQPRVIRLVGNSPLMRENPTDALIIKRAFIKTEMVLEVQEQNN